MEYSSKGILREVGVEQTRDLRYVLLYHDASTSKQAKPSVPSNLTYNHTTGAFTNLPSGWATALGTLPYTAMVANIAEATFAGNQTITFGPTYFFGTSFQYNTADNYNQGTTTQRNAHSNPKGGDTWFDTDTAEHYTYDENA